MPAPAEPTPERPLTAEEVLHTTRAVRKRLDFSRPVPADLLRECVAAALQAPSGSNRWPMQFVIVTDAAQREKLAEVYREGYEMYRRLDGVYIGSIDKGDAGLNEQQQRTAASADYLAEHMGRAPALVVACVNGRAEDGPAVRRSGLLGSVLPGMWSFMLAARMRGLGTCWTTVHLQLEEKAAEVLGIPYARVTQACLTPVAYTLGDSFSPALRPDADAVIHWDRWTPC